MSHQIQLILILHASNTELHLMLHLCSTSFPTLLCPFPNNLCVPKPQNTPIPTPNPVPNYLNIRIFPGYVISPPIISTQTLIPLIKFNQIHQQITMLTHTLQVPQTCTIGRYQYLSSNIIGEGFYGKVYRGHRTADRKKVAVKIVNLEEHHDAEELEFIDNELKISQLLKHERVIDCLEIYKKSNKYYFVTELIEDGDLDRYIRERGQLDEGEALRLLKQIVSGMVYIKQKRVIHRDLKPANIFLKDGNVKIADFGLSAFVFGDKMVSESRIGSPRYMAPEVLHQGLYTYKCDVWSLGILFIEMVTGEAPFTDCESFEEIVEKVLQPVIPASLALSELAMEMLSSMLEVRQSKRISIQELQDHLIFNQISKHSSISTNASEDCGLEIQELSAISLPRSRISSFSTCFNQAMNESQIPQPQYEQIQPSYYLLTTSNISESKLEDRTNHSDWSEMVLKVEGVEEGQIRSGQNGYSGGERLSKMDSSDLLEFRNLLWNGVE